MGCGLIRIEAPRFVAGIELGRDRLGVYAWRCAPAVRFMRHWTPSAIQKYCERQGWSCGMSLEG